MADSDGGTRATKTVRNIELDWHSVAIAAGALSLLGGFTAMLASAPKVTQALGVSLVIGVGLAPVVAVVQRRLKLDRAAAVAIVLLAFAVLFASFAALVVPRAVDEVSGLSDELPQVVRDLSELPIIGDSLAERQVPERVQQWIDELPDRLGVDASPVERLARGFATGLLSLGIVFVFVVAMLLDGQRVSQSFLMAVPPHRRATAQRIGEVAYQVVGRYVAGSLLVAGMSGMYVLILGLVLGVPLAPVAAAWVIITNLIPQVGGALGGIPFVTLGFIESPRVGVACVVGFLVWQQAENHVVSPLIVGQAVRLSPPVTMIAALVGASTGGVVGALLAVPLIGAVKAMWIELGPYRAEEVAPADSEELLDPLPT